MTKIIEIKKPKSKSNSKPKIYTFTEENENQILETHIAMSSTKDCKILVPYKSKIIFVNTETQKTSKNFIFIKATANGVLLKKNKYFANVTFEKYKIFAQISLIDDTEKGNFVDFMVKAFEKGNLSLKYNNKHVSFEELVEIYVESI